MPEMYFRVRWPDATLTQCYSPSSTITEALKLNHPYRVDEFVSVARQALKHGSDRVRQRYGFGCGQALQQIETIEQRAAQFAGTPNAYIIVEEFEP
jgi:uncharacterized repeat protein (TIGR04042 family)